MEAVSGGTPSGATESGLSKTFDIIDLLSILPHRYPFIMIDRVVEFEENKRVVAIKNVTINEPFFQGHFPGKPVMPGVMIMEAVAQAGAILAHTSEQGISNEKLIMIVGVEEFKWKRQVTPGDTLRIEMEFIKRRRPLWIMKGTVTVDGKVVALGTLSAAETEKQPER